ncbi:transporter [Algoriphagus sp. H41]|uniref:Transporter n=1 Tax=Algoriphagus oliviformis TaxID=2811231 RepID=A0ABS3BYL6_9BACT|nr:transporter [Algoriphagus oliviformis]MBN7809501.1 transporter [Algoriphagus oliviformis]
MNFYSKCQTGLCVLLLALSCHAWAQSPTDELMMPHREICFLGSYEYGQFDEYWEGSTLRDNATIATVQRRTALLMAAYGLTNKLDLYVGIPYVSTNSTLPNGGKFAGTSGFQDYAVGVKYQAFKKATEKGEFSAYASLNFSNRASDYLSDYQPYALGLGTPQLAWRAIAHQKWSNGLYIRAVGGYVWKGYTQAEREYYYNDGSYYTAWMDVPSSWNYEAVLGKWFLANSLRVEVGYSAQRSTSGDDIRAYNAPQPTNRVNMDRVGGFAHYYFPKVKGLGILAYFSQVVDGKNAPKMTGFGVGATYQFRLLK